MELIITFGHKELVIFIVALIRYVYMKSSACSSYIVTFPPMFKNLWFFFVKLTCLRSYNKGLAKIMNRTGCLELFVVKKI